MAYNGDTCTLLHTFLTIQGHGGPPQMRDKLNAGPRPRQHVHERRTQSFEQVEYERMIIMAK